MVNWGLLSYHLGAFKTAAPPFYRAWNMLRLVQESIALATTCSTSAVDHEGAGSLEVANLAKFADVQGILEP